MRGSRGTQGGGCTDAVGAQPAPLQQSIRQVEHAEEAKAAVQRFDKVEVGHDRFEVAGLSLPSARVRRMEQSSRRLLTAGGLAGLIALLGKRRRRGRRRGRCCESGTVAWPAMPDWADDGAMTNVDAFNTFVAAERPCYRHYPEAAAQAIVGMDPTGASPQPQFGLRYGPSAGSAETAVVITVETPGDDSVEATRYQFTFADEAVLGGTAGVHRLLTGVREFRCYEGRGHTGWGTERCL